MKSTHSEERFLTIGEAARIWHVSADSLRSWSRKGKLHPVPTPGGQHRFRYEELAKVLGDPRATAPGGASGERESRQAQAPECHPGVAGPRSQKRAGTTSGFWNPEVHEAREALEITRARRETRSLRLAMEQEAQEAARRAEAERVRLQNEKRFAELKKYAYSLSARFPIELRQQVVSMLEDFVSTKNIPPSLSDRDADALVMAQVWQIQERHDAKEAEARADAANRAMVERLIQVGTTAAVFSTLSWDPRDAEEVRADVARELASSVTPEWTEADVRRRVGDILGGWEERDPEADEGTDDDDDDEREDDDLDAEEEEDWDEDSEEG